MERRPLFMLAALLISVSDGTVYPRHHQQKHALRQGAFAGTQIISNPGGPDSTDVLFPTLLEPGNLVSTLPAPVPTTDPSVNSTEANSTTRTFPTTTLQVPVATFCPADASTSLSVPYTASPINPTSPFSTTSARPLLNTTSSLTNATEYPPVPTNNSIASPTVTLLDPNARIVFGDDGCQILFTSITTAICSTVLSIGGQLPIGVTDCGEWVTFSSSPDCGAAITPASAEATVYFLAPWYEIASGAVPAEVQVHTCSAAVQGVSGSCITGSESWSVSTKTIPRTAMQTASFVGGAVGPLNLTLIPNLFTISIPSTNGSTTAISIDTTITSIYLQAAPTIIRMGLSKSVESTVTTTLQTPVTMTYQLVAATHHVTVTVTVTVARTITSLAVVQGETSVPGPAVQTGASEPNQGALSLRYNGPTEDSSH